MTARKHDDNKFQRRERERIRRQQERMRRLRRIRQGILCVVSLTAVLGFVWVIKGILMPASGESGSGRAKLRPVSLQRETELTGDWTEIQGFSDVPYIDELTEMESQDSRIREVIENADEYPERILKMLSKNIETLDFVLDYPEKKNLPCADTIGQAPGEGEIPLLIQWDERWGYGAYGESFVAVSGCGPTCIAMVASGLTGRTDITPYAVASYSEENGFLTAEMDTSWDLMTYGCEAFGVTGTMLGLDENAMANTLAYGCPIICSMGPGDFTDNGHFIVITAYEDGMFQVNDPNSRIRSGRTWSYEELEGQIVNMWWYDLAQ